MMHKIMKIMITGGPCAGKTAALDRICAAVDCPVLVVPETATELILSGITPWGDPDFQAIRVARQLRAEEQAYRAAEEISEQRILMIFDRGIADTRAYTTAGEYAAILRENGLTEEAVMDRYDAVIHLTSAAKGAPESYSLQSNAARTETTQEAASLDNRILDAWAAHPNRVILPASESFDEKLESLLLAVANLAGALGNSFVE